MAKDKVETRDRAETVLVSKLDLAEIESAMLQLAGIAHLGHSLHVSRCNHAVCVRASVCVKKLQELRGVVV